MLALAATVGAVQAKRSLFGGGSDRTYPLEDRATRPRLCDPSSDEDHAITVAPPRPSKSAPVDLQEPVSGLSRKRRAAAIDQPPALPAATLNGTDVSSVLHVRRVAARVEPLSIHWESLPCAIWIKAFSLVPYYERMSLALVCKSWRQMSSEWRLREVQVRPTHPWQGQPMNSQIRALLVDWLMEVAHDYGLSPYTFFLGINYLDRFLSAASVDRAGVQAAGAACLWIASKYEEQVPPTLSDFVFVSEATYTAPRLVHMEGLILHHLGFQLSVPTVLHFLNEYLETLRVESTVFTNIAQLFAELSLLDFSLSVNYCPSSVAAAAVYMALNIFKRAEADQHAQRLASVSAYKPQDPDLLACCKRFTELIPSLHNNAAPRMPYRTLKIKYDNAERSEAWRMVLGAELLSTSD